MNDLGLTLAWLAVQVAIVLAPALALHALASRRGPVPGAWVATLSLGLVVVLNAAAFVPGIGLNHARVSPAMPYRRRCPVKARPHRRSHRARAAVSKAPTSSIRPAARGRRLAWLRLAWDRVGRGAAEPAARFRPWGSTLAVVALAGTAVGLLRLTIGLWAVARLLPARAAGRRPDDDRAARRAAMRDGVSPPVALREVPDLTTPATAGRRRPVVLLPDDWRSWSDAERRAVLAHELAHIVRGDYADGPAGPARRGAELLSPVGALDGRAAPAPAGAGGRRDGRSGSRAARRATSWRCRAWP